MTLEGVSRTAIGVARVRALETSRAGRLFDDPYAQLFAALGEPPTGQPSTARLAIAFQIIIRTRFYDDWLLGEAGRGVRQVVLLGAGLDTRAYRLDWPPGTSVYEVDLPPVLAEKERVLHGATPRCQRFAVAADVTSDLFPVLTAEGFDPIQPTAWLAEGLLIYLDEAQSLRVVTTATAMSAPGSGFATERTSGATDRVTAEDIQAVTSMWQGGLGDRVEAVLSEHGWEPTTQVLDEVAARLGRPMSRTTESGFVTARR